MDVLVNSHELQSMHLILLIVLLENEKFDWAPPTLAAMIIGLPKRLD